MARKRSFSDELVALGVRPEVAKAFSQVNGFEAAPQALRSTEATQSVSANSGKATEAVSHVTPIPGAPLGSAGSHVPPAVRGTGDSKQDTPFTNPVSSPMAQTKFPGYVAPGQQASWLNPDGTPKDGSTISSLNSSQPGFDWKQYLTDWGFPPDMVDELNKIFTQYSDPNQASAAALAYIRGTDWYAQHFPGIGIGEKNGLITNEADYRAYVAQATNAYQRFLGRAPTSDEITQYLTNAYNPTMIGEHVQGVAYLKDPSNQFDLTYKLGAFDSAPVDKSQYGNLADSLFGLSNAKGDALSARLQAAQAKFQRIFQGSAATPALSLLSTGQLSERGANNRPDVGA